MFKVGLTGGIASGKSTVSQIFSDLGISIIDADLIARQLVVPEQDCYLEIINTFGNKILQADGCLDRPKMRQLIFSDPVAKLKLEQILHPEIRQQLIIQSNAANSAYCILSIPLLFEANMQDLVNHILLIDIEPNLQIQRLCQRDTISPEQAGAIINSQSDRASRISLSNDIITNDGPAELLLQSVKKYHQQYLRLAKESASSCQHSNSHGQ